MNSTQEKEVDLIGLLFHVLLHWRSVIVMGVVIALLTGGYGFVSAVINISNTWGDTQVSDVNTLTEDKRAAAYICADYMKSYDDLRQYLDQSAYMQLNGNSVSKSSMVVVVSEVGNDNEKAENIAEAYKGVLNGAGAIEYICMKKEIEDTGISDLIAVNTVNVDAMESIASITATANSRSSYIKSYQDALSYKTPVIVVEVLGADEDDTREMAELVLEYMELKQTEISSSLGKHKLVLIDNTTVSGPDIDVINRQNAYVSLLAAMYDKSTAQKNTMNAAQLEFIDNYRNDSTAVEADSEAVEVSIDDQNDAGFDMAVLVAAGVKNGMTGLAAGVVLTILFWVMLYIFDNRIKTEDSIESLYGVSQIGLIPKSDKKKKLFGFVDKLIVFIRDHNKRHFSTEEAVSLAVSRAKIQGEKSGISKLALIGCGMEKNMGGIPDSMAAKLAESEIQAVVIDNVLYNPESVEQIGGMDGAVIVEKAGCTLYKEIADEIELLKRQEIKLLGCIIVE